MAKATKSNCGISIFGTSAVGIDKGAQVSAPSECSVPIAYELDGVVEVLIHLCDGWRGAR